MQADAGGRSPLPLARLTAGELLIRPWAADDAAALVEAARESSAEILPWMDWCRPDYARADAAAFIEMTVEAWGAGRMHEFAVTGRDGRLLGAMGINQINPVHHFANLGYWVRTSAAGRGVAPAAGRAVAGWALSVLGLQRLEIVIAVGNVRSERVAMRLGARQEGVLRRRLRAGGQAQDATMFSLVPADLAS